MISEELRSKVKEVFKGKCLNANTIFQVLKKNPELKLQLEILFNTKPKIYNSLGKLVILIVNDIELKKCIACGTLMSYDRTVSNNSMFCSNKCKLKEGFNPLHNGTKHPHWEDFSKEKQEAIKAKKKKTCLEKYGTVNTSSIKLIKDKIQQTKILKYGGNGQWNDEEIRNKMIQGKYETTYLKLLLRYKKENIEPAFLKEEFKGTNEFYNWKCTTCGLIFKARYHNGQIWGRCFKCHPRIVTYTSSYEELICNFLKLNSVIFNQSDKNIIKPYELDIVIPEKKIAIEFNGSYWHSSLKKEKDYHLKKTLMCQEKGYKLIHIFEYEWIQENKRLILKEKLKAMLNINQQSIYARKCEIKLINIKLKNLFLNKYHIQGKDQSLYFYGLKYNNLLVAVMTFGKPRFNKNYLWELIRYATKAGYRVIGGAGKLLAYFKQIHNGSIITYADRKYSNGNMYLKLGFVLDHSSELNYVWINITNNIILNRYQTQKHKLKNLLGDKFNPELTLKQNMLNNNFYQVFDCGNLVYVLN